MSQNKLATIEQHSDESGSATYLAGATSGV